MPDTVLACRSSSRRRPRRDADLVQFYPDRGRDGARPRGVLLRDGVEVGRVLDQPVAGRGPDHWSARARAEGRIVLAGGLGPDNVRDAIAAVRPWGVDASSSLESAPGVKDHDKVRRLRGGGQNMTTTDFGTYGGRYVPETLIPALDELERALARSARGRRFHAELHQLATTYAGRPTPLTLAERFAPGKRSI